MVLGAMAQAQHNNKLTWTQSKCADGTSNCITGNNVYRAVAAGGPYTKIATSLSPIVTYTDAAVAGNDVWFYVVTGTCKTCTPQESGFSNEAKATTPGDTQPGAPGTLTVTSQ